LEWAVGVFNGTGDGSRLGGIEVDPMSGEVSGGAFTNVPDVLNPAIVARVGINRGGIRGYTEVDLEGGPLRFAAALGVVAELDMDGDDRSAIRPQVDFIVKANGISASGGVYMATAQDGEGFTSQAYDAMGFHLQAGYVLARQHHVAARFASIMAENE